MLHFFDTAKLWETLVLLINFQFIFECHREDLLINNSEMSLATLGLFLLILRLWNENMGHHIAPMLIPQFINLIVLSAFLVQNFFLLSKKECMVVDILTLGWPFLLLLLLLLCFVFCFLPWIVHSLEEESHRSWLTPSGNQYVYAFTNFRIHIYGLLSLNFISATLHHF